MSNKSKVARVPKLRFSEFRDAGEWRSAPLSQLATRGKQKNRDEKIERVLTNSAEFGVMDQRDYFDKDIATQGKLEGYYVVELGDYVYNPRISATAPVGPISKNNIATGVMSPLYTVFKFKDGDNDFYSHFFKTTGWHTYMRQASSTGARHDRMAISGDDFMALPLATASPEEQQKIADCLSSMDDLIAAQARKVNALKTHKKGLMQQLFPREGETQPRLRFPEFQAAKEWEVGPLNQFAQINPRREVRADDVEVSFVPMIAVSENGYLASPQGRNYGLVKKGFTAFRDSDVIVAKITPCFENGKAALVTELINGIGFGSTEFHVVRANNLCLPAFMFAQIYSDQFRHLGKASMTGSGGQQRVPTAFVENYLLSVPSLAEQQCIADCLTSLDTLIAAATQELETLKTHKKGLMQQLFPFSGSIQV